MSTITAIAKHAKKKYEGTTIAGHKTIVHSRYAGAVEQMTFGKSGGIVRGTQDGGILVKGRYTVPGHVQQKRSGQDIKEVDIEEGSGEVTKPTARQEFAGDLGEMAGKTIVGAAKVASAYGDIMKRRREEARQREMEEYTFNPNRGSETILRQRIDGQMTIAGIPDWERRDASGYPFPERELPMEVVPSPRDALCPRCHTKYSMGRPIFKRGMKYLCPTCGNGFGW